MPSFLKTRIAPTPSGFLHLGNAYSFLLTRELARQSGASLLLRIDDMDRERVEQAYLQDVFDTLRFLGIEWNEGPNDLSEFEERYSQRHRMPLYEAALQQLAGEGALFACTCSRTEVLRDSRDGGYPGTCRRKKIPLDTAGASLRLNTEAKKEICVKTLDGKIVTSVLPPAMRDFVVRKKDGFPAYQLTSLADDLHFGVDLIVRGEDLWESTLAQLYLASVLQQPSFEAVTFHHHALLEAEPGKKLSKSAGDTSLQSLRRQGISRDEVLARLGLVSQ